MLPHSPTTSTVITRYSAVCVCFTTRSNTLEKCFKVLEAPQLGVGLGMTDGSTNKHPDKYQLYRGWTCQNRVKINYVHVDHNKFDDPLSSKTMSPILYRICFVSMCHVVKGHLSGKGSFNGQRVI